MSRRSVAAALAIAGCLVVPGTALASGPPLDQFHDRFDFTIEDFDACGVIVDGHFTGNNIGALRADPGNLDRFSLEIHTRFTYVNNANGRVLTIKADGLDRDITVIDNGDGTITDTYQVVGRTTFADSNGRLPVEETGRIVYADTIDLNGTPDDPDDDFLSSFEILAIDGPHTNPEGGNFCEAVQLALE